LAFVGALAVATIAALTAQWRLRVQLRSEEQRHLEDLSFQRGETDRAELRMILDALAAPLQRLRSESGGLVLSWLMFADLEGEAKDRADAMLAERVDAFARDIREARGHEQRVRLRLGHEGDDLAEAAADAIDRSSQLEAALMSERVALDRPDEALVLEVKDQLKAAADRFLKEALGFTGAVLHFNASG
jgi:hypothetical protein